MPECSKCGQDFTSAAKMQSHTCGAPRGKNPTARQIHASRAAMWEKWEADHPLVEGGYMGYVVKGPMYWALHPDVPHVEPLKKQGVA